MKLPEFIVDPGFCRRGSMEVSRRCLNAVLPMDAEKVGGTSLRLVQDGVAVGVETVGMTVELEALQKFWEERE